MADPNINGVKTDLLIAGDDAEGKIPGNYRLIYIIINISTASQAICHSIRKGHRI
jgi:hypothetical protein